MSKETKVTVMKPGQYHDWDKIMAEFGSEYKLQIFRKEPGYCDGLIFETDIDPEEPISADEIRRRWGGRRLNAKIKGPDGTYVKSKTFNFPDPPRDDGIDLVPGPFNTAIRKDEYEKQQLALAQPKEPAAPAVTDMQTMLLQTLIQSQSAQNTNMQNMLVQRVNHLEELLESRKPGEAPQATAQLAGQPFDGLKDTIKMIKEMEQLRAVMGAAQGAPVDGESSPWTGAIEKMLDFVLERERMNMHTKQAQAATVQQIPPLPAAPTQAPTSDIQLIDNLRARLQNADNATKAELIQAVLGEDLDEVIELIPENDEQSDDVVNDACDVEQTDLDSKVLSAEDNAQLNGEPVDDGRPISSAPQSPTP